MTDAEALPDPGEIEVKWLTTEPNIDVPPMVSVHTAWAVVREELVRVATTTPLWSVIYTYVDQWGERSVLALGGLHVQAHDALRTVPVRHAVQLLYRDTGVTQVGVLTVKSPASHTYNPVSLMGPLDEIEQFSRKLARGYLQKVVDSHAARALERRRRLT